MRFLNIVFYLMAFSCSVAAQTSGMEYLRECDRLVTEEDYPAALEVCPVEALQMMEAPEVGDTAKVLRLMEICDVLYLAGWVSESVPYNVSAVNYALEHLGMGEYAFVTLENLFALGQLTGDGELLLESGNLLIEVGEAIGYANSESVMHTYYLMGTEYSLRDQLAEAEQYIQRALDISLRITGQPDSNYASMLVSLSEVYSGYLKFALSNKLCYQSIAILDSLGITAPDIRVNAHTMIMLNASNTEDFETMVSSIYAILELIPELEPLDQAAKFIGMIIPLVNYDLLYGTDNSLSEGLDDIAKKFTYMLDTANADPIFISSGYMAIGNMYLLQRMYDSMYTYYNDAARVLESRYGQVNTIYMNVLNSMAMCAEKNGDIEHAQALVADNLLLVRKFLGENFTYLSEQEQANLLIDFDFIRDSYIFFFLRHGDEFPEMHKEAADFGLQLQGILLRNVAGLRNRVLQQGIGDPAQFDRWIALKERAAALQLEDEAASAALLAEAEKIEKEFNFQLKNLEPQAQSGFWEQLRAGLQPNQAAVQFIRYEHNGYFEPYTDGYFALVTLSESEAPMKVNLCTDEELGAILEKREGETTSDYVQRLYTRPDPDLPEDSLYFSGDRLYTLIWEPLEAILSGIDTILYSPVGQLNKIAFQALQYRWEDPLLNHHVLIQRRFLPEPMPAPQTFSSITVAGGIHYSPGTQPDEEQLAENRSDSWLPLGGTVTELNFIRQLSSKKGIAFRALDGDDATEEDFRDALTQQPEILHLGTHGFFLPNTPSDSLSPGAPGYAFKVSSNPLQRSGLLLTGGNDSWQNGTTGDNDGILTASEISNMNLLNTKLVVLSACETGLGDIQGDEGVYGLQRAFAMAGAGQLIMSLWKVPDQYTAELMQLFYSALFEGNTPLHSLRMAQQTLAKKTGPYNWAAFVLVQ